MDFKLQNKTFRVSIWLIAGLMAYSQNGLSTPQPLCDNNPCSTTQNYFAALGNYFENGAQPEPTATKGWFSGRCYTRSLPSWVFGGLLVVENHTVTSPPNNSNGPLFPSHPPETHQTNITSVMFGNVAISPFNYDSLTANVDKEISDLINMPSYQKYTAYKTNGSLISINNAGNVRYEVRQYEHFLISQAVVLRYSSFDAPGDVLARCYFFKKIKDLK